MSGKSAPVMYDDNIAAEVCSRISRGETIQNIEQEEGMPSHVTLWNWRRAHPDFDLMFQKAREDQVHSWADQIVGMMDAAAPDDYTLDFDDPQITKLPGPKYKGGGRLRVRLDKHHLSHVKEMIKVRQWVMARIAPGHYGDQKTIHNTFSTEMRDDRELIADLADALQQSGMTPAEFVQMLVDFIEDNNQEPMH